MELELQAPKHLWILGLRRSGTTAIWRMFRGLDQYVCYDEPFNPKLLAELPNQHRKGTWDEFIRLWEEDRRQFLQKMTVLSPEDETLPELSQDSEAYLRYLMRSPTIADFTRLNFKGGDLAKHFPDATIMYLFRSPKAFATSHIINSENRSFLRQPYYRYLFFSRLIGFDSWGIESSVRSRGFTALIEQCGIIPRKSLRRMLSVEKILLYWLVARRTAQNVVNENASGGVFIAGYEDIIDGKCEGFSAALSSIGICVSDLRDDHLRRYSLGHRPNRAVWREAARNAGFTDKELETYIERPIK